jgi:hypothetical protein
MKRLLFILAWTPPLAVPAVMLMICASAGLDLDMALSWRIAGNVWRLGNVLDIVTLAATMWEIARADAINREGLIASMVSMIVPRTIVGGMLFMVPQLLSDPHVVNLLIATIAAPGIAGLLRVSVARRDISLAR